MYLKPFYEKESHRGGGRARQRRRQQISRGGGNQCAKSMDNEFVRSRAWSNIVLVVPLSTCTRDIQFIYTISE